MNKADKVFIAGHRGLVGSAFLRRLGHNGYTNICVRNRQELDLIDGEAVKNFFDLEQPDCVILAAAKVGGIYSNNQFPAQFIYENILIEAHVIHAAYLSEVKQLLFLGSSCIYPKLAPQPLKEDYLLSGKLEPTNQPYAVAKIAGIELCNAYNRQYGTNFMSVMPTNLYGPGDNYDFDNSHVLPALLRKTHIAKICGKSSVEIWGTGKPLREFMYSDDLADACIFLLENYSAADIGTFINIGVGKEISIRELAITISNVVGFTGDLMFDTDKPDGTPRKLMDSSRLHSLGWSAPTSLVDGIERVYADFLRSHNFLDSHESE